MASSDRRPHRLSYVSASTSARPRRASDHTYTGQRSGFRVPGCRFGVVDVASRRCAPPPPPRPEPEPEPEPEEERDCGWKPCFLSDAVDRVGDAAGAVGEFVDEHKVEILTEVALTAVSFVPVAGPVVRVGMLVHRGMSASRVARAVAPVTSRVSSVASRVGSAGRRGPDLGGCVAGAANSFDGATLVLTADGTTKPISEVEVGDLVLATDPETGRTEAREVTDLIVGEGVKSMVAVTVDTPGPDGVVMATALHPFWDEEDREWVDATDLAAGDLLLAPDGDLLPVAGTRESVRVQTVYNLTVADIHTYYVLAGNTPVLVHNTNPICSASGSGRLDGETVLSGHGGFEPGSGLIHVPRGTCVVMYCRHGETILDTTGNAIETGIGRAVPAQTYRSGQFLQNYTLYPPDGLVIMGSPTTVSAPTLMSRLLRPGMGTCHWAACRSVG